MWDINADFIANMTLPHKTNQPNDFHWVGWLKVRPLMITHPGLNKAFCYFWNETEGNKGANECVSILDKYIKDQIPSSVRVLFITVDNYLYP